jgi:hypothetical protein
VKRYCAFISYSQADRVAARRLHRALEAYQLPSGFSAKEIEPKTRKLGRFFLDNEEMGAATDLGEALRGAIADSESLIVLCSPSAAQSVWVNEEVLHFKRTGRADRIFAVIAAGRPNADDDTECFPPALKHALGEDGALSESRSEPLALDLRTEKFPRLRARLAAGLLSLPFDDLWQRDRRRRNAALGVLAAIGVAIATGAIAYGPARVRLEYEASLRQSNLEASEMLARYAAQANEEGRHYSALRLSILAAREGRLNDVSPRSAPEMARAFFALSATRRVQQTGFRAVGISEDGLRVIFRGDRGQTTLELDHSSATVRKVDIHTGEVVEEEIIEESAERTPAAWAEAHGALAWVPNPNP